VVSALVVVEDYFVLSRSGSGFDATLVGQTAVWA
jgi:hypothetical protein